MRYLVTGAAGFIGSAYVKLLKSIQPDAEIFVIDKFTYAGNKKNIDEKSCFLIKGDIGNKDLVSFCLESCKISHIVHFAAESHVDRSIKDPDAFVNTNILGTKNLLDCTKEYGKIDKFLYVSTDEVYGSRSFLEDPASTETSPLQPRSPYAASKASADLLCFSYFTTYGLPLLITRGSNTFGPAQYPEKLIPLFVSKLAKKEKVPLMGEGLNMRDWLYVYDHCRGIQTVLEKGTIGEVYNIAGENLLTNKTIALNLLELLGMDSSYIETVPHRLGHDFIYHINCEKLKSLGWKQKCTKENFVAVLKKTVLWYLENKNWFD